VFGSFRRLPGYQYISVFSFRDDPYLWILVRTAATSYVGLHRFCRISKQSSPVAYTFGWNMLLMNLTAGGLFGYCSSKCITSLNVPSSKGVSAGPMMTAFLLKEGLAFESLLVPSRDFLPSHDIVCYRRCGNPSWRIRLHTLCILLVLKYDRVLSSFGHQP
jgi:hypothetical protein